ncbi:Ceramide synthase 6 [Puccinia graminis f. sp. tritici]|nr:Ceramide synthase 6 [Puccinia graminis f. sp. tritici]
MDQSQSSANPSTKTLRTRTSSVQLVLNHVTHTPPDHRFAANNFDHSTNLTPPNSSPTQTKSQAKKSKPIPHWEQVSQGFWHDLKTMRWMRHPGTSFRMILIILLPWAFLEQFRFLGWIDSNPLTSFVLISYRLPLQADESYHRYGKGTKDFLFLAFYIIVFSCIRQTVTEYLIRPYARYLALKGTKQDRFVDQGYAVFYWGSATLIGMRVMASQPTWWYNTAEFWKGYPHWRMEPTTKVYYLLQFSYWLQQMLIASLRIEKPRSDFVELIIHHLVTLWLVGWSYVTNLTMIGTTIFVSMDISDTFLGLSKCINYTKYQRTSEVSFAIFLCIWTYFRHWQNIRILYSVYAEYETLVPEFAKRWSPSNEVYLTGWMRWQIFAPIMLLQILNLFWYFLIWRIVYRMVVGNPLADVREEGETDDDDEDDSATKKKQQ